MELRLLRYFLTVAKEQSFTKAAEQLHITQPTLSRQMAAFEEDLGITLFIRNGKKISLTDEGILLKRRALEILNLEERTLEELKGVCLANSSYLREWFELHEVPVYLETKLKEVKEHSVICTDKTGKEIEIPCDSVIGSVGYLPNPLERKGKNIYLVGDCEQVGNLRSVVWGAYETAMKIC